MEPPEKELPVLGPRHTIDVCDAQAFVKVDAEALRALAEHVLEREGVKRAAVSIALVDNAAIEALNARHLGHNWPTDVLSFALSEPGEPALAGELVISAEMAATTAAGAGLKFEAELALYVVHGLLHLCGYDDQTPTDRARMRQREAEHMAALGLTYTYPLVALAEPAPGDAEREPARWSG
jgi:probable rRNA maturation factor